MAMGDHIFVNLGTHEHHGIDCGDVTVIHYSKNDNIVIRTIEDKFTSGKKLEKIVYFTTKIYSPYMTVARANERVGKSAEYNLLFNNCEHFATWCKTGVARSKQVKKQVDRNFGFIPFPLCEMLGID